MRSAASATSSATLVRVFVREGIVVLGIDPGLTRCGYAVLHAVGGATRPLALEGTIVPRLGAALAACHSPFVLVLDDLHALHERACLDAVATLARISAIALG